MATRVLAVGAHPDDIEIGCGGTLSLHSASGAEVTMLILTNGSAGPGEVAVRIEEAKTAASKLGAQLIMAGLMDCELDSSFRTINVIEKVIAQSNPSLIYTHAESDSHQDHRATAAATIAAARQSPTILHFQSPSSRVFDPRLFVDIEEHLATKIAALSCHTSQVHNSRMVDLDAQEVNAAYWGRQGRTRYAEAFEITRVLLGSGDRLRHGWEA